MEKDQPVNKIMGKRYFGPHANEHLQSDLQGVQNNLSVRDIQAKIHDSAVFPLILLMCESGYNYTINHEKVLQGTPIEECLVRGQPLKEGTREKYMKLLVDKALPNARDAIDVKEDDEMAKMIELMHEEDKKRKTAIDTDFDAGYKPLLANGASKGDDSLTDSD